MVKIEIAVPRPRALVQRSSTTSTVFVNDFDVLCAPDFKSHEMREMLFFYAENLGPLTGV